MGDSGDIDALRAEEEALLEMLAQAEAEAAARGAELQDDLHCSLPSTNPEAFDSLLESLGDAERADRTSHDGGHSDAHDAGARAAGTTASCGDSAEEDEDGGADAASGTSVRGVIDDDASENGRYDNVPVGGDTDGFVDATSVLSPSKSVVGLASEGTSDDEDEVIGVNDAAAPCDVDEGDEGDAPRSPAEDTADRPARPGGRVADGGADQSVLSVQSEVVEAAVAEADATAAEPEAASVPLVKLRDDKGMCLCKEGRKLLQSWGNEESLNLLAIVGKARTGKSLFCNYLIGKQAFEVNNRGCCTEGIDLHAEVVPLPRLAHRWNVAVKSGPCVGFIDVEGQGDRGADHDMKLMVSALMASKIAVYNVKGFTGKTDLLVTLGVLSKLGRSMVQRIKGKTSEAIFGHLHVLLRDYQLDLNEREINDYIFEKEDDEGMNLEDSDACDERNKIRRYLRESFRSLEVHVCPPPASMEVLKSNRELPLEQISEEFHAAIRRMMQRVIPQLAEPHVRNNQCCTGVRIANLLDSTVGMANEGSIKMLDLFAQMETAECQDGARKAVDFFHEYMLRVHPDLGKEPILRTHLFEGAQLAMHTAVRKFDTMVRDVDETLKEEHLAGLQGALEKLIQDCIQENTDLIAARLETFRSACNEFVASAFDAHLATLPLADDVIALLVKQTTQACLKWHTTSCHPAFDAALKQELGVEVDTLLETQTKALKLKNEKRRQEVAAWHLENLKIAKDAFTREINAAVSSNPFIPARLEEALSKLKKGHTQQYHDTDDDIPADHMEEFLRHVREECTRAVRQNEANVAPVFLAAMQQSKDVMRELFVQLEGDGLPHSKERFYKLKEEFLEHAVACFKAGEYYDTFPIGPRDAFLLELSTMANGHASAIEKVAVFPGRDGVIKKGMLHKLGDPKFYNKSPSMYRYFVLTRESLCWWKNSTSIERKPHGCVPLASVQAVRGSEQPSDKKHLHANAFDVITDSGVHTLFAGSPDESDAWKNAISKVIALGHM